MTRPSEEVEAELRAHLQAHVTAYPQTSRIIREAADTIKALREQVGSERRNLALPTKPVGYKPANARRRT
jgi:hypothetical protein